MVPVVDGPRQRKSVPIHTGRREIADTRSLQRSGIDLNGGGHAGRTGTGSLDVALFGRFVGVGGAVGTVGTVVGAVWRFLFF